MFKEHIFKLQDSTLNACTEDVGVLRMELEIVLVGLLLYAVTLTELCLVQLCLSVTQITTSVLALQHMLNLGLSVSTQWLKEIQMDIVLAVSTTNTELPKSFTDTSKNKSVHTWLSHNCYISSIFRFYSAYYLNTLLSFRFYRVYYLNLVLAFRCHSVKGKCIEVYCDY